MSDLNKKVETFKKLKHFEKSEVAKDIIDNLTEKVILSERILTQENIINSVIKERDDLMYKINKLSRLNKRINREGKIYKIKVDRILTFNEQHKANYNSDTKVKTVPYTQAFYDYRQNIFDLLKDDRNDLLNIVTPKQDKNTRLRLHIDFHVCNASKDLDNIFKPFIDVLFMLFGKDYDDNQIAQIKTNRNKISGTKYDGESIYFYFERISDKDIIEDDLSYLYEKEMEKDKKIVTDMYEYHEFYNDLY